MKRKTFEGMQCPVARSLEHVGEWWSILIIRDALDGISRFDDFQTSLDIAPNMLTRRLTSLVDSGLLERHQYTDRPPRYEYLLTERGRDFLPVVQSMVAFGNRQFAPEGRSVVIVDTATGMEADPLLIDAVSGKPLADPVFKTQAGPAADETIRRRYQHS